MSIQYPFCIEQIVNATVHTAEQYEYLSNAELSMLWLHDQLTKLHDRNAELKQRIEELEARLTVQSVPDQPFVTPK